MVALSWRQVDIAGVAVAGLISGYVMAIAGLWAGKVPGLAAFDIADFGRRYIVSDRPTAWLFGFFAHLVDSVLLTFIWASVVMPNVSWPRVVSAVAWAIALSATLAGALVAPMSGLGFMGHRVGVSFAATNVLLHVLWGVIIGLVYVP
jgi:hypothetical protein